jgi:hypothetical protein
MNGGMKCRQAIKEKTTARLKCLQQKTKKNQEHYKEKRKETKCVNKERNYGLTTK